MKKLILSTLFVAYGCATHADTINNKSSQQQQMGYSYGFLMGRSNAETLSNINLDAFVMGLKQGSAAEKSSLTDEAMAIALLEFKKINEA